MRRFSCHDAMELIFPTLFPRSPISVPPETYWGLHGIPFRVFKVPREHPFGSLGPPTHPISPTIGVCRVGWLATQPWFYPASLGACAARPAGLPCQCGSLRGWPNWFTMPVGACAAGPTCLACQSGNSCGWPNLFTRPVWELMRLAQLVYQASLGLGV